MKRIFLVILVLGSAVATIAQAQDGQWKQLFNGKDLTGWKHVGPGEHDRHLDGLIETQAGWGYSTGPVARSATV